MRFYRVVKAAEPARDDFFSWVEKGKAIPDGTPPDEIPRYQAVSVHITRMGAEAKARRWPRLGSYVVSIDLPEGEQLWWEQTGSDRTHYSIHGSSADELLAYANPPAKPVP